MLKLQRKTVLPEGLTLYRGLGRALLPPEFYASAKATGIKGLTEFGFMSTTSKVQLCCSVLQCVAVCCSVLRCVAVCCSVLQCVAVCVAVCCSVLQCVAVCCSVLQCVQ